MGAARTLTARVVITVVIIAVLVLGGVGAYTLLRDNLLKGSAATTQEQ